MWYAVIVKGQNRPPTARTADKFDLYEKSVQTAESDARFLSRRFRAMTGRPLRNLREDFCGTANILCEFVKLHRLNKGIGIDLDLEPLTWRSARLTQLLEQQRNRILLLNKDVREVRSPKVDLITALNFSYFVFKTRAEMLQYLKNARRSLVHDGVMMLDVHGGIDIPIEDRETWRVGNFKYAWEVKKFDPVTHNIVCKIHFLFRDGSRIQDAFVYDWRLWTLPELQELFDEAGFRNIHVLWEGTDRKTRLGNGVLRRVKQGRSEHAWYAVVVGQK